MRAELPSPRRPTRRQRGFTLIELVMVIVLIGVLAAVAVPRFLDMRGDAERSAIEGWVGALRSAQNIAHVSSVVAGAGYTSPFQMSLYNLVRCDNVAQFGTGSSGAPWLGHHIALAGIRGSLFSDVDEPACNGDTITFTSKSNRVITISGSPTGVTWSASPAY